jgi:DNA-binding MarR family transcriptional regulator
MLKHTGPKASYMERGTGPDRSVKASIQGGHVIALLHRAGQAADALFADKRGGSLTPRQFTVLAVVAGSDGLSQAQISEFTGIDQSTTSILVKRLAGRRLIRRPRSRADQRYQVVRVSPKGTDTLREAQQQMQHVERIIWSGLESMRREEFIEALRALAFLPGVRRSGAG